MPRTLNNEISIFDFGNGVDNDVKDAFTRDMICDETETQATASRPYAVGETFIWTDRKVYEVTKPIASGATLTPGTNGNIEAIGSLSAIHRGLRELTKHVGSGAGFHNSVYRGKYLGSSVTADQYAQISAGTFDDLFVGDYWTINGVNYRIAAFDYWLHCGDTECTTHHVVIVPDSNLASAKMNATNITTGGYVGSDIYTGNNSNTGLSTAKSTIISAFGSAHILSHRELLANAVTDGIASGWSWYDSTVELMNEEMVYGHAVGGKPMANSINHNCGIDKSQLPLFQHDHSKICNRANWWLRSVVSASNFAYVTNRGYADSATAASTSVGVCPAFAICA